MKFLKTFMEKEIALSSEDTKEREALRQYEENERYLRRYEDEAKSIMAFIIGFFIYAISVDFTKIISDSNIILKFIFSYSLLFVIFSFLFTFKTYKIDHSASGSKLDNLIKKQNSNSSLRKDILLDLLDSNRRNIPKLERKGKNRNVSFILFFVGFLIYILIKLIYLGFYQ